MLHYLIIMLVASLLYRRISIDIVEVPNTGVIVATGLCMLLCAKPRTIVGKNCSYHRAKHETGRKLGLYGPQVANPANNGSKCYLSVVLSTRA
jgi:hypothetical protein